MDDQSYTMIIILASLLGLAGIIISFFFSLSMYKTLKRIPEKHYIFPIWFVWLMMVPIANIVFQWMMLPFGIPKPIAKAMADNELALKHAKKLFSIGLAAMILITLAFIPFLGYLLGLAGFVLWIVYWFQVVDFRRTYLEDFSEPTDAEPKQES